MENSKFVNGDDIDYKRKRRDSLGNEVNTGDVLLELGIGYGSLSGSDYKYHLKLWEMPNDFHGHGYPHDTWSTRRIR